MKLNNMGFGEDITVELQDGQLTIVGPSDYIPVMSGWVGFNKWNKWKCRHCKTVAVSFGGNPPLRCEKCQWVEGDYDLLETNVPEPIAWISGRI